MKKIILSLGLLFMALTFNGHAADLKANLDAELDALMEKVVEWRHDVHQHPELGNREFKTAKKIADHLRSLDIRVETGNIHAFRRTNNYINTTPTTG